MRTIDADALIALVQDSTILGDGFKQAFCALVNGEPTIEPELTWHECFDDDPASFPDDERNVLVSFSNFSLSIIGQWRVDENGAGCWYLGDTDETFLSEDLFVDGWWELPKKPRRN